MAPRTICLLVLAIFVASPLLVLVGRPGAHQVDVWRLVAWIAALIAFLGLLALAGARLRGHWSGLLIDRRNRYSLSRLQIVAWTVLAVPSLWIALCNNALRSADVAAIPVLQLEWTLVALMGISLGSMVAAPVALSVKTGAAAMPADMEKGQALAAERQNVDAASISAEGKLLIKETPDDARLSDLLLGEEVGNAGAIDIARLQMLAITVVVWLVYCVTLLRDMLSDTPLVPKFPTFDDTLLALLLVSHAGYLTGKVVPNTPQRADTETRRLARVLSLLAEIDGLVAQLDSAIAIGRLTVGEEHQLKRLREQTNQMRANAENARSDTSAEANEMVAALEGQFAAVKAAFRSIVAEGGRPAHADEPGPDLIREVKRRLAKAGTLMSAGEGWTSADDQTLDDFLKKLGLSRADLAKPRYRAFEDILDLV